MKNSIKAISAVLVFAILALSLLSVTSSAAFVITTADNFELIDWIVDNNNQNTVNFDLKFLVDSGLWMSLSAQSASSLFQTKVTMKIWDLGEYSNTRSNSWYYSYYSNGENRGLPISNLSNGFGDQANVLDAFDEDDCYAHFFYFSATVFGANSNLTNIASKTVTGLIIPDGNLFEATFYVNIS